MSHAAAPIRSGKPDAFPQTQRTWLGSRIGRANGAGLTEANQHIMVLYAEPLKIYFKGCSLRWLGDADDMVQGFFASRLSKQEYLSSWLTSGRPLRYWLIVGFKHFLLETARSVAKVRDERPLEPSESDFKGEELSGYDRQYALSLVREATTRAQRACEKAGLERHWRVFVEHHVEGQEYELISVRLGIDRARAAVMARTAATRFKAELRELVAWEGAGEEQVDAEIRSLLEAMGS